MRMWHWLGHWSKSLFARQTIEEDLDREIRAHLEAEEEEQRSSGLGGEDARYAALRSFGSATAAKEAVREAWGWSFWQTAFQDLQYGVRVLGRSPLFTTVAVLTLAIAIGANTAIFSLVDALLLRPLPYQDPDRLVMVWGYSVRFGHINTVSAADFSDWKNRNTVFEDLAYSWDNSYTITGIGEPVSAAAYQFSTNFFPLLGAKPVLGRTFTASDGEEGHESVVVLSYRLWASRFASDPGVIGRSITMDGKPYTVIGVMPPAFAHPGTITQLWTSLTLDSGQWNDRSNHILRVAGRLKPGVSLGQAQAQMNAIAAQLEKMYPETNAGMGARVQSLRDTYVGDIRHPLLVLQIAVLFILLIACANIANLLLTRASSREREVSIRLALGAGDWRLLRQFLTEGLLLATVSALLGILLAFLSVRAFPFLLPATLTDLVMPARSLPTINTPVLLFALLLTLLASVLFGIVPVLRSPARGNESLHGAGRSVTESKGKGRLRNTLVVVQIALSLVLLAGAGLMIRSLVALQRREFGFRTDHLLTVFLLLPTDRYGDTPKAAGFIQEVLTRVNAVPGVESTGAVSAIPLTEMSARRRFSIPGQPVPRPGQENQSEFRLVTPDYFRSMGIPLLKGRFFDDRDKLGNFGVAIISESMATRFWPGENPLGKQVSVADAGKPETREIVGVVGDTRSHGLASEPQFEIYRPFYQAWWPGLGIVVHTSSDPLALASAVQRAIWSVDPEEPVNSVVSMEQLARESLMTRRVIVDLLGAFSGVALFLTCLGIYGVIAYTVNQQTTEIGIRMALGATSRSVLSDVLSLGLRLAVSGIIAGVACGLAAGRFLRSLVFGVSTNDPATFGAVCLLILVVATLAALIPARRPVRIDPMAALKYE